MCFLFFVERNKDSNRVTKLVTELKGGLLL